MLTFEGERHLHSNLPLCEKDGLFLRTCHIYTGRGETPKHFSRGRKDWRGRDQWLGLEIMEPLVRELLLMLGLIVLGPGPPSYPLLRELGEASITAWADCMCQHWVVSTMEAERPRYLPICPTHPIRGDTTCWPFSMPTSRQYLCNVWFDQPVQIMSKGLVKDVHFWMCLQACFQGGLGNEASYLNMD